MFKKSGKQITKKTQSMATVIELSITSLVKPLSSADHHYKQSSKDLKRPGKQRRKNRIKASIKEKTLLSPPSSLTKLIQPGRKKLNKIKNKIRILCNKR